MLTGPPPKFHGTWDNLSSSAGTALSIAMRNFLNSTVRCRRWIWLITVPSAMLNAATGSHAVPGVVVGAPLRHARHHRQHRLGAVQRLHLRFRAPRGAALPDGGERTLSPVCRSRPGKLRAARPGRRRGGWEQP